LLALANNFIGGPNPGGESQPSTPKTPTPEKSTPSKLASSPSTPPAKRQKSLESPVVNQNLRVRELAEQRDSSRCVLTGSGETKLAHIYPYHLIKEKEEDIFGKRHIFWDHLKNFWSKEKVATWEAKVFPEGISEAGVERVYNLITLSVDVHRMWCRGAFALKPVSKSDDKKILEVQFFWQRRQSEPQTISLTTTPFSTDGLDHGDNKTSIFRQDNGQRIKSGDYFTIKTDDPDQKPLPSFQLLELQWFLQRIQGMAGPADVDWPSLSESGWDSDEGIPNLDSDPVEDSS
jgi:HNH endonuclease